MFISIAFAQFGLGWMFIYWLLAADRGPKEPRKLLILSGVFGALACAGALALELAFLPDALTGVPSDLSTTGLLGGSLLIGLIEEGCKALPLLAFLVLTKSIDEVTDGIIFFGISGMVFGVIEDISYAFSLGPAAGIGKIITGPFIHAGFSILVGWTLSSAIIQKRVWVLPVAGFAAAVGLHGLYDFGLFYGSVLSILMSLAITIFVNLNIFWLMRVSKRADAKLGIAADGANLYCRNCGRPNPQHFVFCPYCGQRT
ncbi:PrsW family intramembrane metalloprotease [Aeromicrobium sp.]|nr:PrsW family intramembrane metalloprotease [Candidatus Saccharibacteria bacterium]